MLYYSASRKGFFDTNFHENLPTDCVQITEEYHIELLNGQTLGKQITADNSGYPILEDMIDLISSELKLEQCKTHAKSLLFETDWTQLADANILNKDEFINYRSELRKLVFNPVQDPKWPAAPDPLWM